MKKLKQVFVELRQNTPVHIQWLFLFAAFLVVVILLLLLLSGPGKQTTGGKAAGAVVLSLDPAEIEWRNVAVGDERTQTINVTPSAETIIREVLIVPNAKNSGAGDALPAGLSQKSFCTTVGPVSQTEPCAITLSWKPDAPISDTGLEIQIIYHGADIPADMSDMARIPLLISAKAKDVKSEPAPMPAPVFFDDTPDFADEFEPVLPDLDFFPDQAADYTPPPPMSVPAPMPVPAPAAPVSYDCLEFAFPGYDLSGRQSGWVRPAGGRFLFHLFDDYDCKKPVGEYDMNTGLIYDLQNPSKSIGSDAERIGGRAFGPTTTIMPQLSSIPRAPRTVNRARQINGQLPSTVVAGPAASGGGMRPFGGLRDAAPSDATFGPTSLASTTGTSAASTVSSKPTDRQFVLRQYKPIPATIVNEVRADARTIEKGYARLPVTATVDRHVYSDNGRTIILPAGTQLLGYATGELPGPYRAIGRMQIDWYRFVRPDGVEFNFVSRRPFSADSQGRVGVPGRGSTDYIESMIMPMMTALVPAAVNLIAPISDRFVNQIDLDNNTVTQSGQVRSSELAKQEIISTWNNVVQRLVLDMMDNTTPPFSIAAGTRITVFSPTDLIVTCGTQESGDTRSCAISEYSKEYADYLPDNLTDTTKPTTTLTPTTDISEWMGQVRSLNVQMEKFCDPSNPGQPTANAHSEARTLGIDYRTVIYYCQTKQYNAINNVRWDQYYNQQQQMGVGNVTGYNPTTGQPIYTQDYNQNVLGLQYQNNQIQNPFNPPAAQIPTPQSGMPSVPTAPGLFCEDGTPPDGQGCCTGEVLTDMAEQGWNCCPMSGGDCFPPLK